MSDIKIINGDFFQQKFLDEQFDLIIADPPWNLLWNYHYVIGVLARILKTDGTLIITVDTGSSARAFFEYVSACHQFLTVQKVDMFEDGQSWGNIIRLVRKENKNKIIPSQIIRIKNGVGIHPNTKDKALYEWIVETFSKEGDLVLDPFMGEGTTAVVCREKNRNYIGVEIEKEWFDYANSA